MKPLAQQKESKEPSGNSPGGVSGDNRLTVESNAPAGISNLSRPPHNQRYIYRIATAHKN